MSAALAFYTIFALPGLLIIVVSVAGLVFETQSVEDEVIRQVGSLLGTDSAHTIRNVIDHVKNQASNVTLATAMGIGTLLFGSTGAFAELLTALNTIWGVKPDPKKGDIRHFIKRRILSFGMILSIGFMLLVSLMLSTLLSIVGSQLDTVLPGFLSRSVLQAIQFLLSFGVITFLFAAIFKVLPDANLAWKDVLTGAVMTAFVFEVGKELIGLYLGNSNIGSAYGAASSLAVLLVWVYFSALVIYWGAEFTKTWVEHAGRFIKPRRGARQIMASR